MKTFVKNAIFVKKITKNHHFFDDFHNFSIFFMNFLIIFEKSHTRAFFWCRFLCFGINVFSGFWVFLRRFRQSPKKTVLKKVCLYLLFRHLRKYFDVDWSFFRKLIFWYFWKIVLLCGVSRALLIFLRNWN